MLWNNINFWRLAAFGMFAAVLILAFPLLKTGPRFMLESSSMELVSSPQNGALFKFTVKNEGRSSGDVYVSCNVFLYERGGEYESDYTVMGINAGETEEGSLLIPLRPGQTVHDWKVEVN